MKPVWRKCGWLLLAPALLLTGKAVAEPNGVRAECDTDCRLQEAISRYHGQGWEGFEAGRPIELLEEGGDPPVPPLEGEEAQALELMADAYALYFRSIREQREIAAPTDALGAFDRALLQDGKVLAARPGRFCVPVFMTISRGAVSWPFAGQPPGETEAIVFRREYNLQSGDRASVFQLVLLDRENGEERQACVVSLEDDVNDLRLAARACLLHLKSGYTGRFTAALLRKPANGQD